MTVKELIKILQEYPKDALIAVDYNIEITKDDIRLLDEFYIGDYCNPKCEVLYNKVVGIGV